MTPRGLLSNTSLRLSNLPLHGRYHRYRPTPRHTCLELRPHRGRCQVAVGGNHEPSSHGARMTCRRCRLSRPWASYLLERFRPGSLTEQPDNRDRHPRRLQEPSHPPERVPCLTTPPGRHRPSSTLPLACHSLAHRPCQRLSQAGSLVTARRRRRVRQLHHLDMHRKSPRVSFIESQKKKNNRPPATASPRFS